MKNLDVNQIGILGCGWLGTQLASRLHSLKWNIKVTKTTNEGVVALQKLGFESYRIALSENSLEGDLTFFENLDQLLISIPPKRDSNDRFSEKIDYLINSDKIKSNCRVIFLSSTSVYGKREGIFNEVSTLSPETDAARHLALSEKLIQNSSNPSVIVRLGGLIGKNRNPIFQLHKKVIPNPEGVINFIHEIDAVEGIFKLLSCIEVEGVFNLVSPHHPRRKDYYLQMAKKYNLSPPEFTKVNPLIERRIEASKIQELTDFDYLVDNLLI